MSDLPKVVPMIRKDLETGNVTIYGYQRWVKAGSEPRSAGIDLFIATDKDILLPQPVAHDYVVKYMNYWAGQMIADGYTPRPERDVAEGGLIGGFANGPLRQSDSND